jgi:DNA-directed RNA polymerase subunit RPC12/RpoP
MSGNKESGDYGEQQIVKLIPCPNCGKKLILLPPNFPLYDIQCSGCNFRAQVKTNKSKPKAQIFGAGWDILEKVLKAGFLMPPLFVYFEWEFLGEVCHEIRFYPFIPRKNLKKYTLSETAKRANYKMFNYIDMDKLPYFLLSGVYVNKNKVGTVDTVQIGFENNKFLPVNE